jgi:hypothetical protein
MKTTFRELVLKYADTYEKKNHDYADGGDEHGAFIRVADFFKNYPNLRLDDPLVICYVYMFKQLEAVLWNRNNGHDMSVEGIKDKMGDISIYSTIATMLLEDEENSYSLQGRLL